MVKVQLQLVVGGVDGLTASELQGVNQVLMRDLGELAALIGVEVDVIDVQRGSSQTSLGDTVANDMGISNIEASLVPAEVVQRVELDVDADLVVLQGDQWQSQTRVAAEPELQRNVQGVRWGASQQRARGGGNTASAIVDASSTRNGQNVGQLWDVSDHLLVTVLLAGLLSELVPDVHPITVVLVDALTTDLDLHKVDQVVANPVQPTECSA